MRATLPRSLRAGGPLGPTSPDAGCIEIGLVNNMPDSALKGTERQFRRLLTDTAPEPALGRRVRLRLFTLPEIPRSDRARQHCDGRYGSLNDLLASRLDALIVTGAEPHAARLRDEPYWNSLAAVFDWACGNTISTILSCLAAHAAALHFDGIERTRLPHKRLGVFDHEVSGTHMLTRGGRAPWRVAHSRWNELPEAALASAGYTVLSRSEAAGPDLFVRQRGGLFVHFQGHPEYDADTLLKEYQRDIRRFLAGEQAAYPSMPSGYLGARAAEAAQQFQALAMRHPSPEIMDSFPSALLGDAPAADWSAAGRCIYGNWLHAIAAEKALRAAPRRRGERRAPSRAPMLLT